MPIGPGKMSIVSSICSTAMLVFCWCYTFLSGTDLKVFPLFIIAFLLSIIGMITGVIGIVREKEGSEKKLARAGTFASSVIFVPMAAVIVILLVIWISR